MKSESAPNQALESISGKLILMFVSDHVPEFKTDPEILTRLTANPIGLPEKGIQTKCNAHQKPLTHLYRCSMQLRSHVSMALDVDRFVIAFASLRWRAHSSVHLPCHRLIVSYLGITLSQIFLGTYHMRNPTALTQPFAHPPIHFLRLPPSLHPLLIHLHIPHTCRNCWAPSDMCMFSLSLSRSLALCLFVFIQVPPSPSGMVWCGVVWCGVVWCGLVCCVLVWCRGVGGLVWSVVVWCRVVGCVWCGVSGLVWCVVVCCGFLIGQPQ
jgi:hypothetical protein